MAFPTTEEVNERRVPFARLLGIEFQTVEPERLVATMTVRPDMVTRPETLHGGAVMSFADTVGAVATVVNLPAGMVTTTMESKTNFVRAAPVGTEVTGTAEPVHKGRSTQVWTTRITLPDGRLVAQVTQTQMVMPVKS